MTALAPRQRPRCNGACIMQDTVYRRATCNAEVDPGSIRVETHEGRDHLVAPVVAVREMVLKDELLPADEIQASEPAWNGRVLPIGHPTDADGEFVSANSPDVHDSRSVGKFFEADASDSALTGEIWVDVDTSTRLAEQSGEARFAKPAAVLASHADDVEAANVVSDLPEEVRAAANAEAGDVLEVSTAYFYRQQDAVGTHDGQSYEATQHDLLPDHLALLPNSEGECSVEDGCGAPRVHVHANVAADGGTDADGQGTGEQEQLGNFTTTHMSDHIEWLAENSAFDSDTLADYEDDDLAAMRESIEAAADHEGCQCGAGNSDDGGEQNGNGDDGQATEVDVPDEVHEKIESLESDLAALRETREAERQERAKTQAERIVSNSTSFDDVDDVFGTLGDDPDNLEMLAEEFVARSAGADFGGRVGANGSPGGSDEDESDYLAMVQRENPTRFGEPEESD